MSLAAALHSGVAAYECAWLHRLTHVPAGRQPRGLLISACSSKAGDYAAETWFGVKCIIKSAKCRQSHCFTTATWRLAPLRAMLTAACSAAFSHSTHVQCAARDLSYVRPLLALLLAHVGCVLLCLAACLMQPDWYSGLMLLAPMISLDKVKQRGLNPILM